MKKNPKTKRDNETQKDNILKEKTTTNQLMNKKREKKRREKNRNKRNKVDKKREKT